MLHHRTKVTRTISIMELLLIKRMLTPINDSGPIHQPGIIDEKNRSTSRIGKGKRTESEQREGNGCNCEYCKSPSSKAEGNLEEIRRARTSMKGFIGLERNLPSEEGRIKFIYQILEGARFRDKFLSLRLAARTEDLHMHHTTRHVQSEMRSKKSLHGMEHTNFTKSSSRPKDKTRMSTRRNFFSNDVTTEAKNTATDLAIHSQERMYIVDSGASLHVMGYLL